MALDLKCYLTLPPPVPPQLDIPNFGILTKANGFMDRVLEPADLLAQMQDQLAMALAPVKRYLEMVEVIGAFQACITAIPESIMTLSPQPIFDCHDNLRKYIGRVLSWIPPISYYAMGADVASYCIDVIDELLALFKRMDTLVGKWINIYDAADAAGEIVLAESTTCAVTAVIPPLTNGLQMMIFAKIANEALLRPFARMPCPPLSTAAEAIGNSIDIAILYSQSSRIQIMAGIKDPLPGFNGGPIGPDPAHIIIPVPGLAPILDMMAFLRETLVFLYNLIAGLLGRPEKDNRTMPTFKYLGGVPGTSI